MKKLELRLYRVSGKEKKQIGDLIYLHKGDKFTFRVTIQADDFLSVDSGFVLNERFRYDVEIRVVEEGRVISEVVNQIKQEVPDNFNKKIELFNKLDKISYNSKYRAPEIAYIDWGDLSLLLREYLQSMYKDKIEWVQKISLIIQGKGGK